MERLIILLKAPRLGTVKTRLAASLGPSVALAAYREMVERLLVNLQPLRGIELRYSPDDALADIQPWVRGDWRTRAQGKGDLGQRLILAFADAFQDHARRVVIIGSDCPAVTADDIHAAWTRLTDHDLVVGPAADGGYWLIGLTQPRPALFQNVAWSTDAVLAETLRRADQLHLRVHLLRPLADIDTEQDWQAFVRNRPSGTW